MKSRIDSLKNKIFIVRWIAGIIYANLPESFNKREAAISELTWCMKNISKSPDVGYLREIYYHLALAYRKSEDSEKTIKYLKLSGYKDFNKQITLASSFAVSGKTGFTSSLKQLKEIIPGKIFLLTGFEFTEFYFIVSQNRKELIGISASTRPESAKAAYEYLISIFPDLPKLTTVLITHSHPDHTGGHLYFRQLNPNVKFYTRDNYKEGFRQFLQLPIQSKYMSFSFNYFFGEEFKKEYLTSFKPDKTISKDTKVVIGGTSFNLIPVSGGETSDGMFIHLPEHSILFVGDFMMPYIGAPFIEEGSIPGLFKAIDLAVKLNPKYILHGHSPLTLLFNSPAILVKIKKNIKWLYQKTLEGIGKGMSRTAIQHLNLIPPFLINDSDIHISYLVIRENVINRVYDQKIGYWQPNLDGMDNLSEKEYGSLLTYYLELDEDQLISAIEKMIASGDYELAVRTVTWSLTQLSESNKLKELKKTIFLKLKEKYSVFNRT